MENTSRETLKEKYSLRERVNIYAGMALGAVAPILASRYVLFKNFDGSTSGEIDSWISTAVFNAITLAPLYGVGLGAILGIQDARDLRSRKNKKKLETLTQ